MKILSLICITALAVTAGFSPPSPTAHSPTPLVEEMLEPTPGLPNHDIWNQLLKIYVSDQGKVNYKGLKQSATRLDVYLKQLVDQAPESGWTKDQELAYWINVYNAFTVKLIVDNYPVKSIMDIDSGKPWDRKWIRIGGNTYSLSEIENDVIRKKFNEPRIHFAVNCASVSCPKLLNEAYTADKLNTQLEVQSKAYINNPLHNSITATSASISELFNWYKADFVKGGTLIDFLNRFSEVKLNPTATLAYKQYDWRLNE